MRILFQGDSITDCGRSYNDNNNLGRGYPHLVEAELGYREPGQHEFFNRGISGNRIVDVYARIKRDIINLKPDVMSILIGVNDVWHELGDSPNGVDPDKFFKIYCMLIEDTHNCCHMIKFQLDIVKLQNITINTFIQEYSALGFGVGHFALDG